MDVDKLLKRLFGESEEDNPEKELEEIDLAEEWIQTQMVPEGYNIPDEDKEKYLTIGSKIVYYPPKRFYGKNVTPAAFIDLMRKNEIVPITIGNIHVFTSWRRAKEDFGYAILFKYLFDTYKIMPTGKSRSEVTGDADVGGTTGTTKPVTKSSD